MGPIGYMETDGEKATEQRRRASRSPVLTEAVNSVLAKYTTNGWAAYRAKDGPNHIIAHKDKKLHFVQVVTPETVGGAEYQEGGIPRNTFIQNAFSNGALPVHALVAVKRGHDAVSFTNVNDGSRVVVSARQPAANARQPKAAPPAK